MKYRIGDSVVFVKDTLDSEHKKYIGRVFNISEVIEDDPMFDYILKSIDSLSFCVKEREIEFISDVVGVDDLL